MTHWEDIVKDKLEGYETPLPEGSLARFRARLAEASAHPAAKRSPIPWVLGAAAAAVVAAVLLLSQPRQSLTPTEHLQTPHQPASPVVAVVDSIDTESPDTVQPRSLVAPPRSLTTQPRSLVAHTVPPQFNRLPKARRDDVPATDPRQSAARHDDVPATDPRQSAVPVCHQDSPATDMSGSNESSEPVTLSAETSTPESIAATQTEQTGNDATPAADDVPSEAVTVEAGSGTVGLPETSPFVPTRPEQEAIDANVAPAAVGVVGGGTLAGAAVAVAPLLFTKDFFLEDLPDVDMLTQQTSHYMPIKAGLSVRFPVSERLGITSGLDYSLYLSRLVYTISGAKNQAVHSLNIPLRLDCTLARNRWLDVYVGAGVEGSYCLGAFLNGQGIGKDGFDVSIVGAGGIQYNLTGRLGIYVEPQLSFLLTGQDNILQTYRSTNPLMFCVSTGFRYTFR